MSVATPLMQQYREIKARHQDAILFFRMGDFYEMFYEDAEVASRVLGLTLTSRNNGGAAEVPLAGVPVKACAEYLRRLVRRGFRVAVCEQVEDPKLAKGVVKREVIETVTPGAVFADDLLDGGRNNFLCAARVLPNGRTIGVAAADVSTGELRLAVAPLADADALLARLAPREVLLPRGERGEPASLGMDGVLVTEREAWEFDPALGRDDLARQFGVLTLEAFGVGPEDAAAVGAAGALLRYLRELQPGGVPHLARPRVERPGSAMPLDEMTRRNLELVDSLRGGQEDEQAGTLLGVLDRTQTPMGARLLRQWLLAPLTDRAAIDERLDAVAATAADAIGRAMLREALDGVRDVERLASKAAAGRGTPRELRALGDSLGRLPAVCAALTRLASEERGSEERGSEERGGASDAPRSSLLAPRSSTGRLSAIQQTWDGCGEVGAEITGVLVERPPLQLGDEATVAPGVDAELDELRALRDGGKDAIAEIQAMERDRTGISSLKVGYNRVFGYFIEISNAHRDRVPNDYQRRQTLTNGERYVTPALKEYEERVLTAAERIEARERELFEALRARAGREIARLQRVASCLAELDVLAALAEVAERERYVRPALTDGFDLEIVAGRHPVVERMMAREKFIPNDVRLTDDARLVILTGPNMAGKSTILRQVGLVVLMAQVGSFVPATRATIGLVDRLFTRVGASDNLVRGQSTFMVEMTETSAILNTATRRSLVLLDEIGRGTSTYDGVSIAWSVSEHLHDQIGCKTIFATHYHELVQLAEELSAVRNFTVAVREVGDQVLFLHRLVPGGADRSYGIEVGRLAGLPGPVIARAKEVLALLEGDAAAMAEALGRTPNAAGKRAPRRRGDGRHADESRGQLALFVPAAEAAPAPAPAPPHPAIEALRGVDANHLTPMQALELVARLSADVRA